MTFNYDRFCTTYENALECLHAFTNMHFNMKYFVCFLVNVALKLHLVLAQGKFIVIVRQKAIHIRTCVV